MKNSLSEFLRVLAYNILTDPLYTKLEKAMEAVKEERWPQADTFLGMIEKNFKDKVRNYAKYPILNQELPQAYKKFEEIMDMVGAKDSRAEKLLDDLLETFKETIGPEIKKHQFVR